jgi:hypothetical protein
VEDLAGWVRNFDEPVVGDARMMQRVQERGILSNGDTITYAFGLMVGNYRGQRTVSHGGSWAGFRTNLHRFPDAGLDVILLANTAEMNAVSMVQRIADIYIPHLLATPCAVATTTSAGGATSQSTRRHCPVPPRRRRPRRRLHGQLRAHPRPPLRSPVAAAAASLWRYPRHGLNVLSCTFTGWAPYLPAQPACTAWVDGGRGAPAPAPEHGRTTTRPR